jgi:hypothetical protein
MPIRPCRRETVSISYRRYKVQYENIRIALRIGFSAPSRLQGGLGGQARSDCRSAEFRVNTKEQVAQKKGKIFTPQFPVFYRSKPT